MEIPDNVFNAIMGLLVPALGGWIWNIQNTVTKHEQILEKLDTLLDVLLKDRLSKG